MLIQKEHLRGKLEGSQGGYTWIKGQIIHGMLMAYDKIKPYGIAIHGCIDG